MNHAAVVVGLTGNENSARRLLGQIVEKPFEDEMLSVAAQLASYLGDPVAFRRTVLGIVEQCRSLRRFGPDPGCLDDAISSLT